MFKETTGWRHTVYAPIGEAGRYHADPTCFLPTPSTAIYRVARQSNYCRQPLLCHLATGSDSYRDTQIKTMYSHSEKLFLLYGSFLLVPWPQLTDICLIWHRPVQCHNPCLV